MKIFKSLLLFLIITITFGFLTSCKKDKDSEHIYVGIYLDIIEKQNYTINDRNYKLYINPKNKNGITTNNPIYEYTINANPVYRVYEVDGVKTYYITSKFTINCDLKSIDVCPIVFENNTFKVLKDEAKTIELEQNKDKSVKFNIDYLYNDEKYNFSANIIINQK